MNEQELLKNLAGLPREISPEQDPWPGISARIGRLQPGAGIAHRPQSRFLIAAAASVVVAVLLGLLLRPTLTGGPAPSLQPVVLQAENLSAPGFLYAIDAEYQAAFREFISVNDSANGLQAETIEKIELTWADMRGTENALTVALEENPGDLFLNHRMLELRARQLGFLKQLVSLDRNNRRLTI